MNDQSPAGGTPEPATELRLVTKRVRTSRPLGGAFWLTALVAMAALVAVTTTTQREPVETALEQSAHQRLADKGLGRVKVVAEGRDLTAKVLVGTDEGKVERLVAGVAGVATVTTKPMFASAQQAKTCSDLDRALDKATRNQRIPFVGETARLTPEGVSLVRAAAVILKRCPVGDVVVGGHADDQTPDGATLSLARARAMIDVLERNGVAPGRLDARGYGDQFPVNAASTDAARQQNQRGSISPGGY